MNDPKKQSADGCKIFFTFLLVSLSAVCFVFLHEILQPDDPDVATKAIDDARMNKIREHHLENDAYVSRIDSRHNDLNSSLQLVMKKVTMDYQKTKKHIQ